MDRSILNRMADRIAHRGPDDMGAWLDANAGIGLAHRRLAVVDLSPAGHQPMQSASGRYIVAFNGEIYNHKNLRRDLESKGHLVWRGHSDTETMLAGFEHWGVQNTLGRAIGMFAMAIWDRDTNALILARDRLGEKPLYFGWQGSTFLFGSELKALRAHPAFHADIDRGALCLLMRHNCIPAPYSIFQGIGKLRPGCLLTVSLLKREPKHETYWSAAKIAESGNANMFKGGAMEAVDRLEALLKDAVRQQMMADVPLGAFLSGGVDSSTVVALMQAQSDHPIKTFTIGFDEGSYDEAVHAKAVAAHLGTDHTELYVSSRQALDVISKLPSLYCEPFSDSSQIPTFLVSRLARQDVTVSLSGDAGDELFCGYNRYVLANRLWKICSRLPKPLRRVAANALVRVSPSKWDRALGPIQSLLPGGVWLTNMGDKLHKGASILASVDMDALYLGLSSHWHHPESLVIGGSEPTTYLTGDVPGLKGLDGIQRMMALDTLTYLPDDILTKLDRAAMAVSLECRIPFLDHRVVEFAWRLPQSLKLHNGVSKWILRQVLYRHVPRQLIERPKAGFGVPIDSWLRGPLRGWAEELLNASRLSREGYFRPEPIRQKWIEHLSGKRNWAYCLWDVLMFQAWLEYEQVH